MEETTKKWEFRALCSKDMFPMFKIINKIGFKEFKDCFQSDSLKDAASNIKKKNEAALIAVGTGIFFDLAGIIITNISSCEEDIYALLSSVSNLSKEEIQNLSMADFADMIIDFVQKPDFADFFKVVSKLFK